MTTIKILGADCPTCKRLFAEVNKMVTKNNWQVQVEYVTDLSAILAYGVMSTPVLVVNEKLLMSGYPGAAKVEQALKQAIIA